MSDATSGKTRKIVETEAEEENEIDDDLSFVSDDNDSVLIFLGLILPICVYATHEFRVGFVLEYTHSILKILRKKFF